MCCGIISLGSGLGIDYGIRIKKSMDILRCITLGGIGEFIEGNEK